MLEHRENVKINSAAQAVPNRPSNCSMPVTLVLVHGGQRGHIQKSVSQASSVTELSRVANVKCLDQAMVSKEAK